MKSLIKWSKVKLAGAIAILALLVPSLAFAALNPVLDPSNVYQVANRSVSATWGTSATAQPGQTLTFMVHVHNNVFNTTATNVRVRAALPQGEFTNYTSVATVSADNSSTVSGRVNLAVTQPATLEYIPGSTVMYNHANQVEANLPDGITGNGITVLNALQGCWEYERWVMFKARVVAREIPLSGGIRIIKFNDINGSRVRESNEPLLSGWQFRISGPNGFERTVATDANGQFSLTGLPAGRYIVTEINQAGWENTTGLTLARDLVGTETQEYVFGNRQTETPPPNGGGGELPVSGPADAAGATGAAMTFSGAILAWIRSKKNLISALRK